VAIQEGTQSIPAPLLDAYRATLGEATPGDVVRKRYPFRMPTRRNGHGNVTAKQAARRESFKTAIRNFSGVTPAERARWYAAMPAWSSFLWYYNYFIMSSLNGNADGNAGGFGLIKSIKHYPFTMLAGAPANIGVVIDEVDATKTVVMIFGSGYNADSGEDPVVWWAWVVYPHIVSIATELVTVKASDTIKANAGGSITVIEYI